MSTLSDSSTYSIFQDAIDFFHTILEYLYGWFWGYDNWNLVISFIVLLPAATSVVLFLLDWIFDVRDEFSEFHSFADYYKSFKYHFKYKYCSKSKQRYYARDIYKKQKGLTDEEFRQRHAMKMQEYNAFNRNQVNLYEYQRQKRYDNEDKGFRYEYSGNWSKSEPFTETVERYKVEHDIKVENPRYYFDKKKLDISVVDDDESSAS